MKSLYTHLPTCPGVYLMKNAKGGIIYIGKSNNLKARTRSYFVPNASLNFAKKKMIQHIAKIDFIETKSDLEALMLETNLIKKNQPKYNVLMKDGKNLSYITITDESIPCLIKTRFKPSAGISKKSPSHQSDVPPPFAKGAEYFGPYSQYFDTRQYVRFVRKLFRLGNHEKIEYKKKCIEKVHTKEGIKKSTLCTMHGNYALSSPCMDTFLGLCPGHCTGDPEKIRVYLERLEQAREFLRGKHENVLVDLRAKMQLCAEKREFEQAQEYKGMIEQIEATGNQQIVRDVIDGDALVVVGLEKYGQVFLSLVEVKNGMTVGVHEYTLRNPLDESTDELLAHAVLQYIGADTSLLQGISNVGKKGVIFTDCHLESSEEFAQFITSEKIHIKHPARGEKVRLLEFAHMNLLNFAYREAMEGFKKATLGKKDMLSLLDILFEKKCREKVHTKDRDNKDSSLCTMHYALDTQKEIIFECFDISHSHGEHTVASKSVLVNGKPDPKRYKKYRIKTLQTGEIDDFAAIEEILTRRTLAALRSEDPWPDLIIIDGGKGQLGRASLAIQKVLQVEAQEGTVTNSPLEGGGGTIGKKMGVSITEGGTPPTPSEGGGVGNTPHIISLAKREEEVFLPGRSAPVLLEKGSRELMLLQKIRDEAHRFAINYNRSSREKGYTKTIFDELPGIGPVARRKILSHISRVEELQTWSLEKAEKAFGKKTAIILQDHGILQG